MECPKCFNKKTGVAESRMVEMVVCRRRKCPNCGHIFYTEELEISSEQAAKYFSAFKKEYRDRRRGLK